MISRILSGSRFPSLALLFALVGLGSLNGCNSGTSSDAGLEMKHGHYFILSDRDDMYRYDQYFVVLPGNRWEFVEYGYLPEEPSSLCQVTRQAGNYRLGDTSLTMTETGYGESVEGCGMTKAQFQAYPMVSIPASERSSETIPIRNRTAAGFESVDLYTGAEEWKTYTLKADPYGFY